MIRQHQERGKTTSALQHAQAVQERRVKAGKFGYAKSVRRWLVKQGDLFSARKDALPVAWPKTSDPQAA